MLNDLLTINPPMVNYCPKCGTKAILYMIHRTLNTPEGRRAEMRALLARCTHQKDQASAVINTENN